MTAEEYIQKHWGPNMIFNNLNRPKHQERLKKCTEYLTGGTFLDYGCAFGHSTFIMKGFHPGLWFGYDQSETAMKTARETFKEISFIPLLKSDSFSGVICSEVIEHVEDDKALLEELTGLTSEVLIITTPNRLVNDPGHLRVYSKVMLISLAEKYSENFNFKVEESGLFYYLVLRRKKLEK